MDLAPSGHPPVLALTSPGVAAALVAPKWHLRLGKSECRMMSWRFA